MNPATVSRLGAAAYLLGLAVRRPGWLARPVQRRYLLKMTCRHVLRASAAKGRCDFITLRARLGVRLKSVCGKLRFGMLYRPPSKVLPSDLCEDRAKNEVLIKCIGPLVTHWEARL